MTDSQLDQTYQRALAGDPAAAAALRADARTAEDPRKQLAVALCGEPSTQGWLSVCRLIGSLDDSAVPEFEAAAARWPASLREARCSLCLGTGKIEGAGTLSDPLSALLKDGVIDPRLSLLSWVSATLDYPQYTRRNQPRPRPLSGTLENLSMRGFQTVMRPVIRACAQQVDPGFTASNRVSHSSKDRFWNNDSERIKVGRKNQGVVWAWSETEHAADDSYEGSWKTYGLNDRSSISMERFQRGQVAYSLSVGGPTPGVLGVAALFGWLFRIHEDVSAADILAQLQSYSSGS